MGGRLPGGFSIRGLSGGERRRLNIAAGGLVSATGWEVQYVTSSHPWVDSHYSGQFITTFSAGWSPQMVV